eukprot:262393-Pelagomonas_calceolata.AAC.1
MYPDIDACLRSHDLARDSFCLNSLRQQFAGTVSVGGNGPCPGETEERNDIMNKVKEMLGRAFDFPQDENLLEIRQPDYNPGAGGAIFREGINLLQLCTKKATSAA